MFPFILLCLIVAGCCLVLVRFVIVKRFRTRTRLNVAHPAGLHLHLVDIRPPPPNACNNALRSSCVNAWNACNNCATRSLLFSNGAHFAPPCVCVLSFSLFSVSPTRFWSCCFESTSAHCLRMMKQTLLILFQWTSKTGYAILACGTHKRDLRTFSRPGGLEKVSRPLRGHA